MFDVSADFYYQGGTGPDWYSRDTVVVVNPERLRREPALAAAIRRLPDLGGHVWIPTSGSSADSPTLTRFVALSKEAFLASAGAVNVHLDVTPRDVWAHALPVFHVGGLAILARACLSGTPVIVTIEGRWQPQRYWDRITEAGATLGALVPSQIHDLVEARLEAPGGLRAVVVGGAALRPELYQRARALGWPCLPSYGLTETCSQVATASLASLDAGEYPTVLPLLSHARVRCNTDQRLEIRSTSLLTCYADCTDRSARVWDPKCEGWLETGDLGQVTDAGLTVTGRASESVKILGEVVHLAHVEDQLVRWAAQEPLLAGAELDLAVLAVPHARLGSELVLALASPDRRRLEALSPERLWESLDTFTGLVLLPFERIRKVMWVDQIPRTPLGKCQRRLLALEVGLEPRSDR